MEPIRLVTIHLPADAGMVADVIAAVAKTHPDARLMEAAGYSRDVCIGTDEPEVRSANREPDETPLGEFIDGGDGS